MNAGKLLHNYLSGYCEEIHNNRLQAVMDVAEGLQKSQNLALSAMGRNMPGPMDSKHKIKKVDRLESNEHLHSELESLYEGLSSYIFQYISKESTTPVIIDLCYLKDSREIQMLSAEVALKGRSLPLYREVFRSGGLKGRAQDFITKLSKCIPVGTSVIIVMDAGFGEDWFAAVERIEWHWLVRVRQGKQIKLSENSDWLEMKDFFDNVGTRAQHYPKAQIMKYHERNCRLISKKNCLKNTKKGYRKQPRHYNAGNGDYARSWKEPWVLATNLPDKFNTTQILNFYKKRMQIEESFRDLKSHRFGLGARYARTECVCRWGVKMLLAAIVQIIYWIVGIIAHSQNYQEHFQANTVKDKKIFSYFYLGKLMFEHNKVENLDIKRDDIPKIIQMELARAW
jgi:hypothetical protein